MSPSGGSSVTIYMGRKTFVEIDRDTGMIRVFDKETGEEKFATRVVPFKVNRSDGGIQQGTEPKHG